MTNRPNLYLHVGPGKTGTSAIQRWLGSQADTLKASSYLYPVPKDLLLFEGNASVLGNILLRDAGDEDATRAEIKVIIDRLSHQVASESYAHLILSSEYLAGAQIKNLRLFKNIASSYFSIKIILVARHPYPWLWSVWGQFVKRNGERRSFSEFAERAATSYGVHKKFFDIFSDVILLSYSSKNIIRDFARAIGVEPNQFGVEAAQSAIVNRSLTDQELRALLCVNRICKSATVSTRISDYMIQKRPHLTSHMELDPAVMARIEALCGDAMGFLEARRPGCTKWAPPPGVILADAAPGGPLVIPQDVMSFSLKVVRDEAAKNAKADVRAEISAASAATLPRRKWPNIIRLPYKWGKGLWKTWRAG